MLNMWLVGVGSRNRTLTCDSDANMLLNSRLTYLHYHQASAKLNKLMLILHPEPFYSKNAKETMGVFLLMFIFNIILYSSSS